MKQYHYIMAIIGLVLSAFFYIVLGMAVCAIPAFAAGFIVEFFRGWRSGEFEWYGVLASIIGGLIIQLFAIFSVFA